MQECWKHSFDKVESNRKAVLTRSWDLRTLCYNVLLHKEIATMKNSSDTSTIALTSTIDPSRLNTQNGLAGTLIERICLKIMRKQTLMAHLQWNERRNVRIPQKSNWNCTGREFPLACLLPLDIIGLMRLSMAKSKEWKIKGKNRSSLDSRRKGRLTLSFKKRYRR